MPSELRLEVRQPPTQAQQKMLLFNHPICQLKLFGSAVDDVSVTRTMDRVHSMRKRCTLYHLHIRRLHSHSIQLQQGLRLEREGQGEAGRGR
jgi:hypothetical protein